MLFLDDKKFFVENIIFISDVKNLPKLFVKDCYYSNETKVNKVTYYRPMLSLSFAFETLLFGRNTKVNHTVNIILFILSIYLMYVFLLKLNLNKIILKFIILLTLVHPVFTSIVVWIAGRNDSLLTIFVILLLINIFYYLKKDKFVYFILSVFFFAAALFTKESGIILIIITPLFLFLLGKLKNKKIVNLFIGFFLVIILYFYLRSFVELKSFDGESYSIPLFIQDAKFILTNIINGFIVYINKLLIPSDIPVELYDYAPNFLSVVIFIIFVIFLSVIYLKKIVNRNFILFGILFFILFLLPTFAMLQNQILFHRLLLPSLGLILIFVLFIQKVIEFYPVSKKYLLFSFIILFLFFSFGSFLQADKYKNDENFVINGYKDAPKDPDFISAMGMLFIERNNYDKALEYFIEADKYEPGKNLNNIGVILFKQNKIDEAIYFFNGSIEVNKNKAQAYGNLSSVYEQKQDYKKALEYAQKAYLENPYNVDFAKNLAKKYKLNNQYEKAINIYKELLKFENNNSEYYYNIAVLYNYLKDKENAVNFINKAIELSKGNQKYNEFLLKLSEEK